MLGDELRAARLGRGLTRKAVAAAADISLDALKKIEAGERYPNLETLEGLAQALHLRITINSLETLIELE